MESMPDKNSMIHFKNQPRLSKYEADQKYNERRLALLPELEHFIATDELFGDKEVSVEFSHKGVSSLLSFIEVDGKKYVLKIPLNPTAEGEAQFLKAWEEVGVPVPHVYREGIIGGHPSLLMEYIDAPLLTDVLKEYGEDVSIDIGKMLAKMHVSKAQGFGRIVEGRPKHTTFKDWILSEDMQKRYKQVQENNLLGDAHGSLDNVMDTLIAYAENQNESTYCHFDFGSDNILATRPLTVIDPDPTLNHGVLDIGRSILLASSGGYHDADEDLKEGYFSTMPLDEKALQAAIILNSYMKFPYWHKKHKTESMDNVRAYLENTRHLLT